MFYIVNRVFCYSKEIAKRNGNELPIVQLVLTVIIFFFIIIGCAIIFPTIMPCIIAIIAFVATVTYYAILLGIRMKSKMAGYALDTNGRIFKVMTVNNGQGLYFGGVAAGGMIDQAIGNDSHIGENLGGAVGVAAQFYAMNRSAEYLSHPEIIAKIVEAAPNVTGAEVLEILKVHSIIETKNSIKVNCDYKIIRTGKIKYNKNITIEKSYNMYGDLIKALHTHR